MIDAAAAWGKDNNVPLICNEFGVYRAFSPPQSRMNWIRDVRSAVEADGIGWCHDGCRDARGGAAVDDHSNVLCSRTAAVARPTPRTTMPSLPKWQPARKGPDTEGRTIGPHRAQCTILHYQPLSMNYSA